VAKHLVTFRDTYLSASILAIANMGDAFLYAYLPTNYHLAGLSTFWVGVILSINRLTRLFLNGWVAWFLSNHTIKTVIIAGAVMASLSTMSYGYINAVPLWILARVVWGISFSTLRLTNTLYALQHPQKGIALGISRAVIETGPVIALLAGPLILQYNGHHYTFLILGCISIVAILLVAPLNNLKSQRITKKEIKLSSPSSFNILVMMNAFVTDGVLVVMLAMLLQIESNINAGGELVLVGVLLGYKRLSLVVLSPLSGWLADKYGFKKIFIYSTFFSIAGMLLILAGATIIGIVMTFTFSAINASAATGGAVGHGAAIIKEVSDNATWRDIGTASGAFIGALLLPFSEKWLLIILLIIPYIPALLYYQRCSKKKIRLASV
jgi:MFS transporter, DHA1 family, multidrug resistance protein